MKIVCDDKIPYIQGPLQELADTLVVKPGKDITPEDVRDANIIVVRTRTRCDASLLQGSDVRLVVTATIGYDHLDIRWMEEHGISWANCPGCNATSVGQYVRNSLLALRQDRGLDLTNCTLGVVGVGHVGRAVLDAVGSLGLRSVMVNDPPREAAGDVAPVEGGWSTLEQICQQADILTFHTPLTEAGPWPTYHLMDDHLLQQFADNHRDTSCVLINAARGGVVDEQALLRVLETCQGMEAVVDTWEHEPQVNRPLLQRAYLATPHIAGYSADGKANATRMTLKHICRAMGREMTFEVKPPALPADCRFSSEPSERALQLYDPRADSRLLKAKPAEFEWQRGHYPLRREFVEMVK